MQDDLVERLRAKSRRFPPFGGGSISHDGSASTYTTDDGMRLINPDGPEAADTITALRAEVAKARRDALGEAEIILNRFEQTARKRGLPHAIVELRTAREAIRTLSENHDD